TALTKAIAAEALGTAPGSLAYNAGQVFGGTGYSEDDVLAKYYRDAAAWRFLGPDNSTVFRRRGLDLLSSRPADGAPFSILPAEAQLVEDRAQRKALLAELDEIRVIRSRLRSVAGDWQAAGHNDDDMAPWIFPEVAERLGRQEGMLLAARALLLRTHARLEDGIPGEIEMSLLRVWLDAVAFSQSELEHLVGLEIASAHDVEDRPVVEPSAGPPPLLFADFVKSPVPYDSGDFLCKPADFAEPRYVPEMVETDPQLVGRQEEIRKLIQEHFGQPRQGLIYERYLERNHRPDESDLEF